MYCTAWYNIIENFFEKSVTQWNFWGLLGWKALIDKERRGKMDDRQIIELYFERNEQAIKETETKYGAFCHRICIFQSDLL